MMRLARHGPALLVALACAPAPFAPATPAPPRGEDRPAPGARSAAVASSPAPAWTPRPGVRRLVAVGDLHGDLDATLGLLRLAGVVDAGGRWTGGDAVVVQVGDQLDRGGQEEALLERLEALQAEATAAGGALVVLLGNHELMNVGGDLRYVTPEGWADFADEACPASDPDPARCGRRAAFGPGGPWARRLADQPVVAQVGDTLFVHGGVHPEHVAYGLGRLNDEAARWLRGDGPRPGFVVGEASPVWSRRYSDDEVGPEDCAAAREALAAVGAVRMVVGHTVQRQGPNAVCDGAVWRIDVGLSRHYGGVPRAIEVVDGAVRVIGG